MIKLLSTNQAGFALIEVMLATVILGLVASAYVAAMVSAQQSLARSGDRMRAVFLVEEGLEAARSIRDLAPDQFVAGIFGLDASGSAWTLVETPDQTEMYTRSVSIVQAGPDRFETTVSVVWQTGSSPARLFSAVTLLSRWAEPIVPPPMPPPSP